MNLGKLLCAGSSIFGNKPKADYCMNKGGFLPKFNEGRNPFGSRAKEAEKAAEETKASEPAPVRAQKAPPPYAFKPVVKPGRKAVVVAPRAAAAQSAKPAGAGWTARLNPFRTAAAEAAPAPAATQSELTLDAVKVVHNDLADADVEVVPVKSHAAPAEAPVLPPARRAWEYMGENLLK